MRIEFDPTNPTEAAAVRAMLTAMAPYVTAGIVMHEAPTDDAWHNGTTYTPAEPGSTIKVDGDVGFVVPTPETDSQGEPHDPRIHSTPATTNKDGTWRAKRGVTADQIAQVKAEREAAAALTATNGAGMTVTENLETGERTVVVEAEQFVVTTTPPAPPAEKRDTFVIPEGHEAVRDADGRATGETRTVTAAFEEPVTIPVNGGVTANIALSAPPAPPVKLAEETVVQHVAEVSAMVAPSFLDVMKAITAAQKDGKIDTAKVKELCAAVGAGESTMGLNGPDNGDKRVAFMALLAEETK